MSTATTDADLIEIPSDLITVAIDTDGTPMAVPTEVAKATEKATEPKKTVSLAEFHAAQEMANAERQARERAEKEREDERARATEAEKKAGTSQTQTLNAHIARTQSDWARASDHVSQLGGAISQTETLVASKIKEAASAAEAGDHLRAEQARAEVAQLQAEKAQLNTGLRAAQQVEQETKYYYEQAYHHQTQQGTRTTVTEEPKPQVTTPAATPAQPTADDLIAQSPAATRAWLKEHREFATPGTKEIRRITRFVDEYLDDKGDNRDALNSPDFVKALNDKFFPEETESMSEPETETAPVVQTEKPRARTMPAAPVSRGSDVFSPANLNANKVRLPPDLVAFCKQAGLDQVKYAAQVVEEIRKGTRPKDWLEPHFDRGIR